MPPTAPKSSCGLGDGRRHGSLGGPARSERQIACDHIDGHGEKNEECRDPKKRAVMNPLPMRARGRVWSPVLLELRMVHSRFPQSGVPTGIISGIEVDH